MQLAIQKIVNMMILVCALADESGGAIVFAQIFCCFLFKEEEKTIVEN